MKNTNYILEREREREREREKERENSFPGMTLTFQ